MEKATHVVIGTAGHIDHGKSALVRALTGTDPDRLKEEKERGITIDLGFAFLASENDISLAFVDVPGHEKFVKNMLAGVGGIDLVMLVVAADESVMPQTREHFDICRLLEIPRGIIVMTKCDLVDSDLRELAALETRELVAGSFLDGVPVVEVSSTTGEGIDTLKQTLFEQAEEVPARKASGLFRLPVDRVFSMKGFGTVVTGTLAAGAVHRDDEVEILPRGSKARIRGLQVHGEKRELASAGQRTAVNLQGIDTDDVARGDTLTIPATFAPTMMLDAELDVLASSPVPVKDLIRVHVHVGTAQVLARVRTLGGKKALAPGDTGIVQLRLESPVVAARGDRFILRRYSPLETIAGGLVLDARPEKHAVTSSDAVARVEALRAGDNIAAAVQFVAEAGVAGLTEGVLARRLGIDAEAMTDVAAAASLLAVSKKPRIFIAPDVSDSLTRRLKEELTRFQKKNPLLDGMPKSELREKTAARAPQEVFEWVLAKLVAEGGLRSVRDLVATADHSIQMSPEESQARDFLVAEYRESGYRPKNLSEAATNSKRDVRLLERVQRVLLKDGTLVQIADGMVFHRDVLEELKETIRGYKTKRDSIDVSFFKEMAGVTRKHAIPLLEWLDRERVTQRSGNERRIL
ncbi:MAG: selenocysteine-specific translation elongation factor [Acidobacteriota bacterium]|nr:MAG: selenocysteine-specific translation elongation factor [Acidobacteriota bacterium]